MKGFPSRITPAKQADRRDQDKAEFHEDLAAVEPVDGSAFQGGFGEKAVEEKSGRSEINAEMERLPKMAAQPKAKIRSDHHEAQETKGYRANGVFERLARRTDRVDKIQESKPRVLVQKQNGRMQKRHRKSDVARPVMESKIIEPPMRPRTMRAIAKRHQHPEKEVQSNRSNSHKADISRKVENGDAHGQ